MMEYTSKSERNDRTMEKKQKKTWENYIFKEMNNKTSGPDNIVIEIF